MTGPWRRRRKSLWCGLGVEIIFCLGGSLPLPGAEFCIAIRVTGRGRKDCLLPRMVCDELAWGEGEKSELDGVGKTLFLGFLKLGVLPPYSVESVTRVSFKSTLNFALNYQTGIWTRQRAAVLCHTPA